MPLRAHTTRMQKLDIRDDMIMFQVVDGRGKEISTYVMHREKWEEMGSPIELQVTAAALVGAINE